MNENKRFKLMTNQKHVRTRLMISILFLAFMLFAAACSGGSTVPVSVDEEAVQIPAEAQSYIDTITQLLVDDLDINSEQVELESITEPATTAEPYIIKVIVGDITYEYQGLDGEVQLIFISEPNPQIIDE